ncbi:hypothetical protein [Actinoplanes sp. G11-F43]|uniref:hypothetical protein n=1 Tax=Actinoplanes sp. G11-F43 TaxID=3424130 RepID=UPI003D349391
MTAYPYRMRRSLLLLVLMLAAVVVMVPHQHHDVPAALSVCAEHDTFPAHEQRDDSPVAARGRLPGPDTTAVTATTVVIAAIITARHTGTSVDLSLLGVLRV